MKLFVASALAAAAANQVAAEVCDGSVWNSSVTDGDFSDPDNWVAGDVPTLNDIVAVDSDVETTVSIDEYSVMNKLVIGASSDGKINVVIGGADTDGKLIIGSGDVEPFCAASDCSATDIEVPTGYVATPIEASTFVDTDDYSAVEIAGCVTLSTFCTC